MKGKKFLSLLTALTLAMSLSITAFAEDTTASDDAAVTDEVVTEEVIDEDTATDEIAVTESTVEAEEIEEITDAVEEETLDSYISGYWRHDAGGWWFQYKDGGYAKDCLIQISGNVYYFKSNGYMVTGWYKVGNYWIYCNSSGVMGQNVWQKIGGKWYRFLKGSESGISYTVLDPNTMKNGLYTIDGVDYWFTASGAVFVGWVNLGEKMGYPKEYNWWAYYNENGIVSGWKKIGSFWFYFDPNNNKLAAGPKPKSAGYAFQDIDGKTYCFRSDCALLTGWQKLSGKWYFFNTSGAMVKKAWSGNYYFDKDGVMVSNTYVKNGSKYYWVNASGVYTKTYSASATAGYSIYEQSTGEKIQ